VKDRVDTFADFRSLAIQVQAIFFFFKQHSQFKYQVLATS